MTTHNLKIDVAPFNDLLSGTKTGEVRNDDRGFAIGDTVFLTCSDGRTAERTISHIQRGYGLPDGICVLSYTRAVPDVPELVRYSVQLNNSVHGITLQIIETHNGEYVRYDQAAAIIAAKEDQISLAETTMIQMHQELSALEAKLAASEAEIKRLRSLNHYAHLEAVAMRRAEAAEAKLAHIKAQEPVTNYIVSEFWAGFDKVKMMPIGRHPLYAAPVDQTAEIERLREAAQKVIDRWDTPNWKEAAPTADAINNLRSILSGKEPL